MYKHVESAPFFFFLIIVNLEVGLVFISMVYGTFFFFVFLSLIPCIFFGLLNDAELL